MLAGLFSTPLLDHLLEVHCSSSRVLVTECQEFGKDQGRELALPKRTGTGEIIPGKSKTRGVGPCCTQYLNRSLPVFPSSNLIRDQLFPSRLLVKFTCT